MYSHTNQHHHTPTRRGQVPQATGLHTTPSRFTPGQHGHFTPTPSTTNQNHPHSLLVPPYHQADAYTVAFEDENSSYGVSSAGMTRTSRSREFDMVQQAGSNNIALFQQFGTWTSMQPTAQTFVRDSGPTFFDECARFYAENILADPSLRAHEACHSFQTMSHLNDDDFKKKVETCYVTNLSRLMTAERDEVIYQEIQLNDYLPFMKHLASYTSAANGDTRNINTTIGKLRPLIESHDQQTKSSTAHFGGATGKENAEAVFMKTIANRLQHKLAALEEDRKKAFRSIQTVDKLRNFIKDCQTGKQNPVQVAELFSSFDGTHNCFHLDLSHNQQQKVFLEALKIIKSKIIELNSKAILDTDPRNSDNGTMDTDNSNGHNSSLVDQLSKLYSDSFPSFEHDLKDNILALLHQETWKMLYDMMQKGNFKKLFSLVMKKAQKSNLLHPDFIIDDLYKYHNQYSSNDWAHAYVAILFGSDEVTCKRDGESVELYLVCPHQTIAAHDSSIWSKETSTDNDLANRLESVHIS